MAKKVRFRLVLLVEGQTDKLFFERLIGCIVEKENICLKRGDIKIASCEGIGRLQQKGLAKVQRGINAREILPSDVVIVVCYDTDKDGIRQHPEFSEKSFRSELKKMGINSVIFCAANVTIEDWFMLDPQGIMKYLNLPTNTKIKGRTGLEKLEALYKLKNMTYTKQRTDAGKMILSLDICKIQNQLRSDSQNGIQELEDVIEKGTGLKKSSAKKSDRPKRKKDDTL